MHEGDRPSTRPSANPGATGETKRKALANADMYRIAYQESQRTLDDEQDELNRMRDRAVAFTAFVGAASAFLVGTGLQTHGKDGWFYVIAITASALTALLIVLLVALLTPSKSKLWHYRLSATSLIKGWIEADVPPPNEAAFIRALAVKYDEMHRDNEVFLRSLRRKYQWLIVSGTAQLTIWATLVWIKG